MRFVTSVITGTMLEAIFAAVKNFVAPALPVPESTYVSFVCDLGLAITPILVAYNIIPALKRLGVLSQTDTL